jgi:putative MATE family efflux protein
MGAGIMTSQYFGARSRDDLSHTIGTAITLSAAISLVIMIFAPLLTRPMLILLRTPEVILDDAVLYMNVLLYGIMGLTYFNMLSGILRGLGEAMAPLMYLIIASVLNITLNFFFIVILDMGVFGAAIGTVIAQAFTSILCLLKLMRMRDVFDLNLRYLIPKKKYSYKLLKLGIPTGASQAIFAIAMMITQPLVNDFGEVFIAVYVIVMRIDGFVITASFSFGNASTVFAGQNIGANKIDRVGTGTKHCALMSFVTTIIFISIILFFGQQIAGAFTETQEVIDLTIRMLWILSLGFVAFSVNIVLWGTIRGAGDAISPLWGALINTVVVRVPTAFLFVHLMGTPEAIMYSLLAAWVSNLFISIVIYRRGKWRTKSII